MKNIILSFILFLSLSCKAQSPVFPIYNHNTEFGGVAGAYYKDVDNFHDQFVGTWILNDGVNYLKVTFIKKTMFYKITSNRNFYVDYLVGEYEYKVNNVTKVTTLNNLNVIHNSIFKYNLFSRNMIPKNYYPFCTDCVRGEQRLIMSFQELPTRASDWAADADFIMRRVLENGVAKLKVQFIKTASARKVPDGLPDAYQRFSLPFGNYTLIKQ